MRDESPSDVERSIFSVGHSNHALETFLGLLKANAIEVLADTRSQPYSKYAPHFNARELKAAVTAAGIRYVSLGKELGGRPTEAEFYDAEGHVLYAKVAESPLFLNGLAQLEQECAQARVAMFCSEENPSACHRRLLVGRVLFEKGMNVLHIRGDGRIETEAELREAEEAAKRKGGQQSLFETEEVAEWKSIQSVSPKKPPPSFSER